MEDQEKLIEMIERYRIIVEVMQGYLSEDDLKCAMGDIAFRIQQELILGCIDDTENNNN